MIESFFTKEQEWLDKWDNYLQETERGLYNQLSDWIKAYDVYGFDYNFYLITDGDKIVGGCGMVIAKFTFFKFLIVPSGPVVEKPYEDQVEKCITDLANYAKKIKCCYFQMNLPVINTGMGFHDYCLTKINADSYFYTGKEGTKFKYVIPLYGMRIIDLYQKSLDEVQKNFSSNHKRNLKKSTSFNFEFKLITSDDEIEAAYECFTQNAKQKGYPLRTYESIKNTLKEYIIKDFAKIGVCVYNEKIVGAIYVMKCGNRLIYLNGGVMKEYQDLPVSVYMHNEIIKYSIENQYKCYDVSVGGSEGVIRFKEGFGSTLISFKDTRYWVYNTFLFSTYTVFDKRLKKHKQKIAKFLFFIKKKFN